ncbi:branched-chain amino acid transport system substrate-binding protein [Lutimaribacter pacificus]|uniref:Amino acid/amide ABC transporter substrate-binding protein, HAAT family n=1 Tax=Lutimaribacter pacificus TaxID=391948 RepID=A0A1H0L6W1_9RHOB|nr:amino acid ABC transporter substrate-binding protein [Lutimaribacter pacificus]SDO63957.1 branched-chain amino acid transport system substrate-binding protein [Lutimaribacter pacificus]SHK70366.1 amino acid/amide ABC transporter substrate-binding protein, HAAT family [Lutimaribacter pacificus]
MTISRRGALASIVSIGLAGSLGVNAGYAQDADTPVKIGYAISLSGPNAGGAMTTQVPNYRLWVHEMRERGGILVGDTRRPIEVIEYDDRSNSEEAVRAVERLINQDNVDILLAPWGTAINLAVGPLFDRHGYIHASATAITDRAPDLVQRWPRAFLLSGTAESWAVPVVELLDEARAAGHIGDEVAMVSVADAFGIDLAQAARTAFEDFGFTLTYDQTYPVGTQDFSSILSEVSDTQAFVAFSYPPDTIALTDNAQLRDFNPAVMYVGIGGAFPMFHDRFGDTVDGLLTHGGLNMADERVQGYIALHEEVTGQRPDSAGSIVTYAALQAMEQAIARTGSLNGDVVADEMKTGTFDTVLGEINLGSQMMPNIFKAGQISNGYVVGLGPLGVPGRGEFVVPKPAWPAR